MAATVARMAASYKYQSASRPAVLIVIVYGIAMITMRP